MLPEDAGIVRGQGLEVFCEVKGHLLRKQFEKVFALHLFRGKAEACGHGGVGKDQRSIGTEPADHFDLVVDDGSPEGLVEDVCIDPEGLC